MDSKTGTVVLTEELEIVIIELPKMKKYETENKSLEKWLKFIKNPDSLEGINMDSALKKAKDEYEKIVSDEHERSLIKLREKYWLDFNSCREESLERGKQEGYKFGQEEGYKSGQEDKKLQIAKKLISMNMKIEDIEKATGLTKEEIENIKNNKE